MLEGKEKDEEEDGDKSLLRMYNVRYCNDPTEGNYFFDKAKEHFDDRPPDENPFYFLLQSVTQKPLVSTYILSLCDNTDSNEKKRQS